LRREVLAERMQGKPWKSSGGSCVMAGRLTEADLSIFIVAYEPVWAIGTGRTATPEIAAGNARRNPKDLRGNL